MASGENVLWIVTKRQCTRPWGSDKPFAVPKHFIFRTRAAAKKFSEEKTKKLKARNSHFMYTAPVRATWGPEQ